VHSNPCQLPDYNLKPKTILELKSALQHRPVDMPQTFAVLSDASALAGGKHISNIGYELFKKIFY